jgi:integrase
MPALTRATPKYRHHRASGQAIVTIAGRGFYLGPYGTKASRIEYDRLIGEWLAAGRPSHHSVTQSDMSVAELLAQYLRFAKEHYVKGGKKTTEVDCIKHAIKPVKELYSRTRAVEFGPLALRAVRERMIDSGHSRVSINRQISRIRRIFRWAASRELIPVEVYQALATVEGLQKGRTKAAERDPIGPVADAVVEATLPFLSPVVADMVRLQRLLGCRPGELCSIRPCDLDRSAKTWAYRPTSHKTEHHGRERVIFIGPQGQAILTPYLLRPADAYCFSPAESEAKRRAIMHARRKTPLHYGNRPGTNRRTRAKRNAGQGCYDNNAYRRAIKRACDLADLKAHEENPEIPAEQRIVRHWHPNQLRHTVATELRRRYGLEAAKAVLGHSEVETTQVYAERDLAAAARIMAEVG